MHPHLGLGRRSAGLRGDLVADLRQASRAGVPRCLGVQVVAVPMMIMVMTVMVMMLVEIVVMMMMTVQLRWL